MLFPPELVPHVRSAVAADRALRGVSDHDLARLLTLLFFASLDADEGEHLPIRVIFAGDSDAAPESSAGVPPWTYSPFSQPQLCTALALRRLSRATIPSWAFIHVGMVESELMLLGLARRGLGAEDDRFIAIVSPAPGGLEIWSHGRRVLEYARGRLMPAPENVILSAGPVRRALQRAADQGGVTRHARPLYLDCVGGVVRAMAAHRRGGILVISSLLDTMTPPEGGFSMQPSPSLLAVLHQLAALDELGDAATLTKDAMRSRAVLKATLHVEIDRAITEIGSITALDGATLLEPTLAVRAFGVILPTTDRPTVMQAVGAEPADLSPFALHERGARHRAAAQFARDSPESIVFVASGDGDLGCMLRDPGSEHVLMWRCGEVRTAE